MVTTGNEYEDIWISWINGNKGHVKDLMSKKSAKFVVGFLRFIIVDFQVGHENAITEVSKMVN
jgi:hypothetical protein